MKKVLSMILALIMILSIGTVGASATDYRITVAPTVEHVRKDNIAYYPVNFDMGTINSTYAELCESNGFIAETTHIELGYMYRSDTLDFIDAIPAEPLYNLGGTVKVTEHGVEDSDFNYFFVEIDFSGSEGLANEYFFNLKFEVLQEKFINSLGVSRTLIYDYPIYADYENMIVEELVWEVTDSNGTVHDLSSKIDLSYASFGDGYTSYDQLLIKDYEPFIPPVEDDNVENGIYDRITISADVYHARKGDYAYFPVGYDCEISYSEYADNDANSSTKIIIPLLYNDHLIEPVEAIPSEWLYNIGGTAEIIKTDKFVYEGTDFPYIYVEINFDGCADIENDVFFNVKFEVINENFFDEYGRLDMGGLFDNFYIVDSGDVATFTYFDWRITKSDSTVKNISSYVRADSVAQFEGTTYEELLLTDYEPFIPPVEDDIPESQFDDISVDADVFHARIGDYAYFPLAYDCDTAYKNYVGSDEGAKTKIVFPFLYMPDLLEPVEAIPAEVLYNMGGTAEIIEYGSYVQSNGSVIDYFFVEVNFEDYEGIVDETILFNVKCKVLSEEFFDEYDTYKIGIFDNFHMVENGSVNYSKTCSWEITMSDGTKKDISSRMQPPMLLFYDEYDSYDDFVLTDYEPFIPPVCDITEVTYIQQEDTHKDFTVTANGRKSMIQFIEPDGGTRTYDRYHKNVKITSYNADGEVVSAMARDLAYEVWEIYSNMSVGVEINVRGKENGVWDEVKYTFTIEAYDPVVSMELSATLGKKGAVPATVVADEKTEKVMFKMPNNTSVTVSNYTTDENGNRVFTGKAWMNEDGLNEIRVYIRRDNVWRLAGTLEYTVE